MNKYIIWNPAKISCLDCVTSPSNYYAAVLEAEGTGCSYSSIIEIDDIEMMIANIEMETDIKLCYIPYGYSQLLNEVIT